MHLVSKWVKYGLFKSFEILKKVRNLNENDPDDRHLKMLKNMQTTYNTKCLSFFPFLCYMMMRLIYFSLSIFM